MIANKLFRVVLAMFLTFCALAAFAGAQFVLPYGPYPLRKLTTSEDVTVVYVKPARDLGPVFTIPPVHAAVSATTIVSTVSVFSGPGVFGVPATPILTETDSVACSAVFHNPGLALHPCFSRATSLSASYILASSGIVSPSVNVSTVTTTQVKSVTTTRTVTLTLSELSPSSSTSTELLATVTAMCLWAEQAILTPCTSVVAASSKPTSAAAAANPLAVAAEVYFLWALAVGGLLG